MLNLGANRSGTLRINSTSGSRSSNEGFSGMPGGMGGMSGMGGGMPGGR